jgi:sugar (pentulose or hexulose) kinase
MKTAAAKALIQSGGATLGVELGSTRIKLCLVGEVPVDVLAVGSFEWENKLVDGLWTYSLEAIWQGLAEAFQDLQANVENNFGIQLKALRALGVTAMMHGYLAFDEHDEILVPFRTWRNTNTSEAAAQLTDLFGLNIPLRWSVAHLQQAVIEDSEHVQKVRFITTLAGYVHWQLTGQKVLGIGDASGMFPVDSAKKDFDEAAIRKFDLLNKSTLLQASIRELLPAVLVAGNSAGILSVEGAARLDPIGNLKAGAPLCPPEGDAGSGMVATNSVAPTTGNISAGTSIFAMVVLERPLAKMHHELDVVTTPAGDPVAMVHCNNGASELAAWVKMFIRFSELSGQNLSADDVYKLLFDEALNNGAADAGGLLAYNYLAGEPITGIVEGRPLFVRTPDSEFTLANAIRAQMFAMFGTLSIGMDALRDEGVVLTRMSAHGGIFRTPGASQSFLAAALETPVTVAKSASEGGAWGAAVLAGFSMEPDTDLSTYLAEVVFKDAEIFTVEPRAEDLDGYSRFLSTYRKGLVIEATAVQAL